jgi:hypothetical protein
MSLRFALSKSAPFAAVAAVAIVSVPSPARAQIPGSGPTVAVTTKDSLPRLDANGGIIASNQRRQDPASREGVNLQDCHGDQSIEFPLTVTGFAPGDLAQIWATNGSTDCADPNFRPGTMSVHCTQVGTFPLTNTTQTTIKVKTLLGATGVTTLDSFGCPSVDISSITVYFLILRGGAATTAVAKDTVPIKVDTQGPIGLTGVKALPGNQAITISWNSVGEAGAQDIIGAQALCDPTPTPSSATEAGTVQVCTEAGATAPDADAAETPEPTCSTVAGEAGTAGAAIPALAAIPSDGLACTTQAFATTTAVPCGSVNGTTGNTIRIDNISGAPLKNDTVYAVAVAGTDSFGNVGAVSSAVCQFPEPTSDFWSDYRNAGGQSGGCAVEGPAVPVGSFSLMMLGIVMTLSTLRRARRAAGAARASRASHVSRARAPRRNDR